MEQAGNVPEMKSGTELEKGLTEAEARERLTRYGYNEIAEEKTSPAVRFIKKFWGVTPWMLEVTIALEWLLDKYFEAYIIVGLLVFNAILGFFQEEKANTALEVLKEKRLDFVYPLGYEKPYVGEYLRIRATRTSIYTV